MANKDNVFEDYEKIADWFDSVRLRDLVLEKPSLDRALTLTKQGGKVLDLGCGMGEPIAKYFISKGFQVTGVDGSARMIEKARKYIPEAKFNVQDMRLIDLNDKFDLIVLWHSLFHLPSDDQRTLFTCLEKYINPEGILLFTSHHEAGEIWSNNGGEDLYHASLSLEEYEKLLKSNHFEVLFHSVNDKECGDTTIWIAKYRGQPVG
ncbi:MAG: methyltransferase domain-containing protein [Alphaproteobacteria bacterium]|nr:methyltransferase domain-containing protein [Alphaproteobacteria bacterium]